VKLAPNITAVINTHAEGLLLKPTFDSVRQCFLAAAEQGITTELVVVLDRPNDATRDAVTMYTQGFDSVRQVIVDNGDLGLSRNDGAAEARGDYIAFIDGDDMWGRRWLSEAYRSAIAYGKDAIWHPEVNVYFGASARILIHLDSESDQFRLERLAMENRWTALCFVGRECLLRYPYTRTRLSEQIGYEDWGWNLRTLAAGIPHKVVPGVGHAVREKSLQESLLGATAAAACLTTPSDVFRQALRSRPG
jgi:glycosyltransferase involved in cell wall biosynthesis